MHEIPLLQVSELTGLIKNLLEGSLPAVRVEGELSNWRPAPSGHVYCTLKDRDATIQAVMFKGKALRLAFRPRDGMRVRASGAITVYAARGQYQLVIESLEAAGEGDLQALLDQRKQRLAAEGLFDLDRKQPLPELPERVAVITSPTGAAIRDILNVLRRRNAGIRITILPAVVQGDEAPAALVRQLATANRYRLGEVIIIGRGGGSLEDLLAFSDEAVVRAVAASAIPIISAVGHETDWCLVDYAADLRAPTPSAAAELVSASSGDIRQRTATARRNLEHGVSARLSRAKYLLGSFSSQSLALQFERLVQPFRQRVDYSREALEYGIRARALVDRNRLARADVLLRAADPQAILARGFAVIRKQGSRQAIRASGELRADDTIQITLATGSAGAIITETRA
ncbi:MAG: exodeoxyribonuclease VII large subunit [Spirochaetes bacterium GWD1_61_31]|nr:MAG: exodeoxyribonuclease VII large subunit [Spirochaetes bacterium GWB1_60_80]OHD30556.1 MAG: exodeoxyribonuclease VII large subunit [Spirochaetes bacterium GWC1_61_12]OHD34823.1 MAG: exodeoxyribonuclease VII large subunit [Spirochaetes bacterium GWD1_61_31]OHD46669.1 MAG: exodeoxyribonuclease VII large subunit [Spirochaetes bacterium GWE1_60_18]OHD61545.1 MAG: exodeoxyribonuclease VII large subunit [Spirochaetes bacterium GWF1_60_12]